MLSMQDEHDVHCPGKFGIGPAPSELFTGWGNDVITKDKGAITESIHRISDQRGNTVNHASIKRTRTSNSGNLV